MERRAGPSDVHYLLMHDFERRDTTTATVSIDEEAAEKDKGGTFLRLLASPHSDSSRSSTSNRQCRIMSDTLLLVSIFLLLAWPWGLFGAIRAHGGIQMSSSLAESVLNSPQLTTVVVTLLGTLNRILATFVFGCGIVRYGQERVAKDGKRLTVFGVSALLAFRHMSLMWGIAEWWALFKQGRRLAVIVLLVLSLVGFALIPSGTAGLLTPVRFNKTSALTGTEVDFTSTDTDCATWLESTLYGSSPDSRCHWAKSWSGPRYYPTCIGMAPVTDALSAGQKNMVAKINVTDPIPRQPQFEEPVRVLGPLRGVLPIGPDGFLGFNMLQEWNGSSSAYPTNLDYTYTLIQQGLESDVKCSDERDSPIQGRPNTSAIVVAINGTCDPNKGLKPALRNRVAYSILNIDYPLMYWACASNQSSEAGGSESNAATYFLYFRGGGMGMNITCTVADFRSRDYAITYSRSSGYFTVANVTKSAESRKTAESFLDRLAVAVGDMVSDAQPQSGHPIVSYLFSTATPLLDLTSEERKSKILELYGAMVQGILEQYAMDGRLSVSLKTVMRTAPPSCMRPVHGNLTYEVIGWYPAAGNTQVWLLIPMTLMNLASLAVCIAAITMGRFQYKCDFEPMDTRALLTARVIHENVDSDEEDTGSDKKVDWGDGVKFREAF